ncbi:MAG TPA: hypothetical protein VFB67_11875 [Candidatus Polarisedimenticolaceae bacterium]|nr:hypothetical protein [Candidatus Polarisedimenticolaceae bacterium]
MADVRHVESLLADAIELLEIGGFPLAAEALRDSLRGIRAAPTAGARRRRIFQLRDLFDGIGSACDVFFCAPSEGAHGIRLGRTDAHRRDEQRYRRTLEAIQEILALGAGDEETADDWEGPAARVA